jgi:hypothetical protein
MHAGREAGIENEGWEEGPPIAARGLRSRGRPRCEAYPIVSTPRLAQRPYPVLGQLSNESSLAFEKTAEK